MLKSERALRETALGVCDMSMVSCRWLAERRKSAATTRRTAAAFFCCAGVQLLSQSWGGVCEMQHLAVCPTADMQRWPYAASRLSAPLSAMPFAVHEVVFSWKPM